VEPGLLHPDRRAAEQPSGAEQQTRPAADRRERQGDGRRSGDGRRELAVEREALDVRPDAGRREQHAREQTRTPTFDPAGRDEQQRDGGAGDHGAEPDRPRRERDRDQEPVDEDQALRPIDPIRPVERLAARPLPGDVGIAPLVGTDARKERQADESRERGDARERREPAYRSYWLATSRRRKTTYAATIGMTM